MKKSFKVFIVTLIVSALFICSDTFYVSAANTNTTADEEIAVASSGRKEGQVHFSKGTGYVDVYVPACSNPYITIWCSDQPAILVYCAVTPSDNNYRSIDNYWANGKDHSFTLSGSFRAGTYRFEFKPINGDGSDQISCYVRVDY